MLSKSNNNTHNLQQKLVAQRLQYGGILARKMFLMKYCKLSEAIRLFRGSVAMSNRTFCDKKIDPIKKCFT